MGVNGHVSGIYCSRVFRELRGKLANWGLDEYSAVAQPKNFERNEEWRAGLTAGYFFSSTPAAKLAIAASNHSIRHN
jgi:hypothetical protein